MDENAVVEKMVEFAAKVSNTRKAQGKSVSEVACAIWKEDKVVRSMEKCGNVTLYEFLGILDVLGLDLQIKEVIHKHDPIDPFE